MTAEEIIRQIEINVKSNIFYKELLLIKINPSQFYDNYLSNKFIKLFYIN